MATIQNVEPSIEETVVVPPTDLYSDEPPVETDLHLRQILLLLSSQEWLWKDRQDFFASGNLTIYFSPKQLKKKDFRGPDFFVVLGTEWRSRKSWTIWDEDGKYPNLIIEILSESTSQTDRGLKKRLYQDTFRTPEYFWFDPESFEFCGFVLMAGAYQPIQPNEQGYLWSQQLELFLGIHESKLRFFTIDGHLALSPEEAAVRETKRASRMAEKLRELGVDPESL